MSADNNPALELSEDGRQVLAALITNEELDIPMLDHIVTTFMDKADNEMKIITEAYFAHESTWQRVDLIMESPQAVRLGLFECLACLMVRFAPMGSIFQLMTPHWSVLMMAKPRHKSHD